MKTTLIMKQAVLSALLFLLPTSLWAADKVMVTMKILESKEQVIPHNLEKAAQMKGVDIMVAPSIVSNSGKEAKIEIIREHQPMSVAPSAFKKIPVGVTVQVTPHLQDDKIAYTAQFTIAQKIDNKGPKGQERSEVSTRDLFVSGVAKEGEPIWFDFVDPNSAKKLAVVVTFTVK